MLAVKDAHRLQQMYGCNTSQKFLRTIQQIAQAPIPAVEGDRRSPRKDTKAQDAGGRLAKISEKKAKKEVRK